MGKDINSLFQEEYGKLDQLKFQAEKIRKMLVENLAVFLRKRYVDIAGDYVEGKVDVTEKLGVVGIGQMKEKVLQLIKDVRDIANEELSEDRLWSIFNPNNINNQLCFPIEEAIRSALGRIILILLEFNFPSIQERLLWVSESGGVITHLRYPYNLDLSKELKGIIKQYQELCGEVTKVYIKIYNLQEKKRYKEARNLWDEL